MREWIADYFELDTHGTTIRREALAGLTTFVTMACISGRRGEKTPPGRRRH